MSFQTMEAKAHLADFDRIAETLNIEHRRIYYLAGYQVPRKRNDGPELLRRMHVTLRTGDSTAALNQFFELYQTLRPEEENVERKINGT